MSRNKAQMERSSSSRASASFSSEDPDQTRKQAQREIAVRRAAHFATVTSTPSGVVTPNQGVSEGGWAGPFSIANQILSTAAENKAKRELEIQNAVEKGQYEDEDEEGGDDDESIAVSRDSRKALDKLLRKVLREERPAEKKEASRRRQTGPIGSLFVLSVNRVVQLFDHVDSLEGLSSEGLTAIATQLGRERRLDSKAAILCSCPGTDALCLPECSCLEEDTLIRCIEKVKGLQVEPDTPRTSPDDKKMKNKGKESKPEKAEETTPLHTCSPMQEHPLRILKLQNVGHSMNAMTAAALSKHAQELQILQLTGCYKLPDFNLARLLSATRVLRALDLSTNSQLGQSSLKEIAQNLPTLVSLCLDFCTHLTDADLAVLYEEKTDAPPVALDGSSCSSNTQRRLLPSLQELSLRGLTSVTDNSVAPLLRHVGSQLTSLCLRGIALLTDESLVGIRAYCEQLSTLDLSELPRLTEAGLLGLFLVDIGTIAEGENDSARVGEKRMQPSLGNGIGPLSSVALRDLPCATDDILYHLCLSSRHGCGLKFLDVSGCPLTSLSCIFLVHFAKHSLQELDVSFVRKMQGKALRYLVDSCQKLKKLSVWSCTQLSQEEFYGAHSNHDLVVIGRHIPLES